MLIKTYLINTMQGGCNTPLLNIAWLLTQPNSQVIQSIPIAAKDAIKRITQELMKYFTIILLGAFASVFSGCNDLDCHPAYIHASFTDTSQIETSFNEEFQRNYFEIKPGNEIVFKLIMQKAQCDGIYDDERCEFLYFQIDKHAEKFELSPENFLQAGCFYRESAAWHTPAFMEIRQGLMTGEKISEKDWLIHISVTPTSMSPEFPHSLLEYEGVFRKEN